MRVLLPVPLLIALNAHAETIQCPAKLPSEEVLIDGGRVRPARLSFAYVHLGDRYSEQVLQGPPRKRVQGGWDVHYGWMPSKGRWLVCLYGGTEWSRLDRISPGTIQWWGKLDGPGTACLLKIREFKLAGSLSNWSAAASCE